MLQQRMNVFVKPCEQSDARINFVVARKRGAKLNISTLLPLQGFNCSMIHTLRLRYSILMVYLLLLYPIAFCGKVLVYNQLTPHG